MNSQLVIAYGTNDGQITDLHLRPQAPELTVRVELAAVADGFAPGLERA